MIDLIDRPSRTKRFFSFIQPGLVPYLLTEAKCLHRPRMKPFRTRIGKLKFSVPDKRSFLSTYKEIFVYNVYDFSADRKDPVILDCGANVGLSVLYFKKIYPDAQIVAFEPDQQIFQHLHSNVTENHLSNVELVNAAAWKDNTTLWFRPDGKDGGTVDEKYVHGSSVKAVRLKEYLSKFPTVDMFKMDIEGSEFDVLYDCASELHRVQNAFVEYHAFAEQPSRLGELVSHFESQGFKSHVQGTFSSPSPFRTQYVHGRMVNRLNLFFTR